MRRQKIFVSLFLFGTLWFCAFHNTIYAQKEKSCVEIKQGSATITPHRLPLPPKNAKIQYIDLDNDGDPDVLRTITHHGIPVQWIDDDDDMKEGDLQGDLDSDCLMVDRNKDGKYAYGGDFVVDYNDEDNDQNADMQVIADYDVIENRGWEPGHYMICIDTDNDNVFNYINWQTFKLEAWEHTGNARFFTDYQGKSMFMKVHSSTFNIDDLRCNWENPFLFYDPDNDGYTEYAIRFADSPEINTKNIPVLPNENAKVTEKHATIKYSKKITDVRISFDLDNDNTQNNEFDFDMSLRFHGNGFSYENNVHTFKSMRGLPAADTFFFDARWRQLTELLYVGHDEAYNTVFEKGDWELAWFVFDEDDDCHRWERVEFLDPKNIFKMGHFCGGLDHNPQADATGDRGEWDQDFSGKGQLYIGSFDGRLHLLGAEWGAWRIDQEARYYQGWQGWRGGEDTIPHDFFIYEPEKFASVKYTDTDNNQFFDKIEYDLDGDTVFEYTVLLKELGIDDECRIIQTEKLSYDDYKKIHAEIADALWKNAIEAEALAKQVGVNTAWYSSLMQQPTSIREKYHYGFWLAFYLYFDMRDIALRKDDTKLLQAIDKSYFTQNWQLLTKHLHE